MSTLGRSGPQPDESLFPIRTVIEDKEFSSQKKIISPSVRRLDEILFGVTWAVARGPEQFPQALDEPDVRVIRIEGPDIQSLRIFFTFDENEVCLKWVEIVEEENSDV